MSCKAHLLEEYEAAKLHLVELAPREKHAVRDDWRTHPLKAADINLETNNVGIATGTSSNGLVDVDLDCDEAVELAKYFLPGTGWVSGRASKPRSHYWYYVRPNPGTIPSTAYVDPSNNEKILEIRADANQTMVPPSTHPLGEEVVWYEYGTVSTGEWEFITRHVGILATATILTRNWMEGIRHDLVLALTGGLLRAGWSVESVEYFIEILAQYADDGGQVQAHLRAVRDTYEKYEEGESVTGWPKLAKLLGDNVVSAIRKWLGLTANPLYPLTDIGNAERFADQYEEKLRWVPQWKKWIVWSGTHWKVDQDLRVMSLAIESVKGIINEAQYISDEHFRKALYKWATQSQAKARIDALLELAKSFLPMNADQLDCDPHLLNLPNGTYNLKHGRLQEHKPEDFITKITKAEYDESATCGTFLQVLSDLTKDRQDVVDYLQKAVGYSSTALTDEDVFFILFGPGRNGKSTVLETISNVLGDYAMTTRAEAFTQSNAIPSDLARLDGARFISAAETEAGQKMNDSIIKRLTGGDRIQARFMYADWFEFDFTGKIWLATNHKPTITSQSIAVWERIRLIPCENIIPREKRDPSLRAHLWEMEKSGILNWIIEGARRWYEEGLGEPPEVITEATQEYRREMDIIGDFLDECCDRGEGLTVSASKLYQSFQSWARENGRPVFGNRRFKSEMADLGYEQGRSDNGLVWSGINLKERIVVNEHKNPFGTPI